MTRSPHEITRPPRGRILLAGDSDAVERLEQELARPTIRVANLFEAVGEITIAPAGSPIDMVILDRDVVDGNEEHVVRSLRHVDRSLQIVLLISGHAPTSLEQATFDACLHSTARTEEIDALLNGSAAEIFSPRPQVISSQSTSEEEADLTLATILAEAKDPPPSKPATKISPADSTRSAAGIPAVSSSSKKPIEAVDETRGSARPPSPPPVPVADGAEPLGDTDLINALLRTRGHLEKALAQTIRERTGWADVRMLPADAAEGVPAIYNGTPLCRLHCPDAGLEDISAWADWAAHWMELERVMSEHRRQAMQDELTGAWNRRYFDQFLAETLDAARAKRRPVTVMVFDIDDFKRYNDTFGHAAGDDILKESVRLLNSAIRKGDRVCRIGGDEFAVIFADLDGPREAGSAHPESVDRIAQRFQNEICKMRFPKLGIEAPGDLSVSAGLATFPWDGRDSQSLLEHADQLALQSKRRGKNAITLGPGAQRICEHHGEQD